MSQRELADRLGLDEQTIKRRESDKQQPKEAERMAIAQVCGVPLSFIENGWPKEYPGVSQQPGPTAEDVLRLEQAILESQALLNQHMAFVRSALEQRDHTNGRILGQLDTINERWRDIDPAELAGLIREGVAAAARVEEELRLRDASRSTTQSLAGQLGTDAQDEQAADDTRDAADANQGSRRARRE